MSTNQIGIPATLLHESFLLLIAKGNNLYIFAGLVASKIKN